MEQRNAEDSSNLADIFTTQLKYFPQSGTVWDQLLRNNVEKVDIT